MRHILTAFKYQFSYVLRSPINIQLLKTDQGRQSIRNSLKARFKDEGQLQRLQGHYELYRTHLFDYEKLSKQVNDMKKQLKNIIKTNSHQQVQIMKNQLAELQAKQQQKQEQLKETKQTTQGLLSNIGNIVHQQTPVHQDQHFNKILRYYHPNEEVRSGIERSREDRNKIQSMFKGYKKGSKSYQELNLMFGISDLTRGQKVSGHRGYFLCNNGVKLAMGIAQYALQFLQKNGYLLYQSPALILGDVLKQSCQLHTISSDMYKLKDDDLYLIATSEQTMAGYYRGQFLQHKKLPLRMGCFSSCFRRQAGAHGKDINGLFRLHQFQKVQQFVICKQEQSQFEMEKMIDISQKFYQSLNIPYRVIDIVSGQLNDAAIRKIDIEAWYPSQGRFRQLVSVSNCTDYQSRMLSTMYREGKTTKYTHMLNGTLVAIQRAITCFLQHFYNEPSQQLQIPQALQPFVRAKRLDKSQ